jgi:hypothetical protein
MSDEPKYWFPAKRRGWGWGPPRAWQGWAALAAFAVLLVGGAFRILPNEGVLSFLGYAFALCVLLMALCYLKGEPPQGRG